MREQRSKKEINLRVEIFRCQAKELRRPSYPEHEFWIAESSLKIPVHVVQWGEGLWKRYGKLPKAGIPKNWQGKNKSVNLNPLRSH